MLDAMVFKVQVDLYILVVDLTALELHNGSQHLFARHVSRLQMWLQALNEMAAETPVLIVGTHAEQVSQLLHVFTENVANLRAKQEVSPLSRPMLPTEHLTHPSLTSHGWKFLLSTTVKLL